MRRVVVTGIGIWSCIGHNRQEVTQALRTGRSGIGYDESRIEYGFRCPLTGIVDTPDLKALLHRRLRTCMSQEAQYAYMASREAFEQAGIDEQYLLENEIGVLFGNDSTALPTVEMHELMLQKHDTALLGSGLIFQSMNSTVNMNLSTIFHLRGINFSVSAACASGSHSIGLGTMFIRQGLQDVVLVGGAQEVNPYAMAAFDALGTFSARADDPASASRPFDTDRDGLVPSGGAAALVLEDYDHAVARGATILAEVCGYGFSSNGGGISQPSSEGSYIAMQRALADAGMSADDIDYVNAHATSTKQGDEEEAIALTRLFGGKRAWVSSTKSMTGHECWMAGASEAIYSILMMQQGFVAPNINLEHIDPAAATLRLATQVIETPVRTVLSNSFGFGGTNSAIVLRKPQD
ncbi:MAG: beta-ketoacyl-[acyl-carrier-protein] synthase family protein [Paludibacteraceae bacterium]|nr:beta-ketoacyl-[acyl-carrier-protein] synthase family protein [Paludibacteraceae bacterium]